jgi:zinc/manganese transport system substrate-binding protein
MRLRIVVLTAASLLLVAACGGTGASPGADAPSVVVTTGVLGSVVEELVGDAASVTVLMGSGVDPHDWSPSAKDIEQVTNADLVVANGLLLEEGLEKTLDEAEKAGVPVFHATDHVQVREIGEGHDHEDDHEGTAAPDESPAAEGDEHEHEHEGGDPHFWTDPISMQDVVKALVPALAEAGVDVGDRGDDLVQRLGELDGEVREALAVVPEARRKLVTGHESMGYFADRYAFELVGTVIPGLSSQGEVSAGELATLADLVEAEGVPAIFTEIGTPAAVVEAIGREAGVEVVELPSHSMPADNSYFTFMRDLAAPIADALR